MDIRAAARTAAAWLPVAGRGGERRAAATVALAIAAVALGFAALAFGAVAILIASWNSNPVLAAALIALGFCLLAIIAVLLMRSGTR